MVYIFPCIPTLYGFGEINICKFYDRDTTLSAMVEEIVKNSSKYHGPWFCT